MISEIVKLSPMVSKSWLSEYDIHPASPSSVGTARTCRRMWDGRYKGITVPKVETDYGEAAEYGVDCHKNIEDFLLGKVAKLEQVYLDELPNLQRKVDWVRNHDKFNPELVEVRLAHNADGECAWEDSTIRAIADWAIELSPTHIHVGDWKTNKAVNAKGKYRSPYPKPLQLEIIAILLFLQNPEIERVTGEFLFLRHDKEYTYEFYRDRDVYSVTNALGRTTWREYEYPIALEYYWSMQFERKYWASRNPLCKEWCDIDCEYNQKLHPIIEKVTPPKEVAETIEDVEAETIEEVFEIEDVME